MSAVLLVTGTAAAAVAAIAAPASLSSIIVPECTTPAYCALVSVRSSGQRETLASRQLWWNGDRGTASDPGDNKIDTRHTASLSRAICGLSNCPLPPTNTRQTLTSCRKEKGQ